MTSPTTKRVSALRAFMSGEAQGGILLMFAAVAAITVANSPLSPFYFGGLKTYVAGLSVLHWINDALMAVFFLLVGLEIKREIVDGELSTWPRRVLPGIAAAGGMAVPAMIYVALNFGSPQTLRGWAIPSATDIAFALGVLTLMGKRVPVSLKIFLTAVAILDDLGAIAIIAFFYTEQLSLPYLAGATLLVGVLFAFNFCGMVRLLPYLLVGVVLWFLVLMSGVHATLAGVALAFTIPLEKSPGRPDTPHSPLHRLENSLHSWVTYLVVPIFGFANAGVSFAGMGVAQFYHPVTLGIAAGLFLGKQIGIFMSVWLAVRLRIAEMPAHASWPQVYGIALLCGIGFTMSLFIGLLAFPTSTEIQDAVKVGVLSGSILAGLLGAAVLLYSAPEPPASRT